MRYATLPSLSLLKCTLAAQLQGLGLRVGREGQKQGQVPFKCSKEGQIDHNLIAHNWPLLCTRE